MTDLLREVWRWLRWLFRDGLRDRVDFPPATYSMTPGRPRITKDFES